MYIVVFRYIKTYKQTLPYKKKFVAFTFVSLDLGVEEQ